MVNVSTILAAHRLPAICAPVLLLFEKVDDVFVIVSAARASLSRSLRPVVGAGTFWMIFAPFLCPFTRLLAMCRSVFTGRLPPGLWIAPVSCKILLSFLFWKLRAPLSGSLAIALLTPATLGIALSNVTINARVSGKIFIRSNLPRLFASARKIVVVIVLQFYAASRSSSGCVGKYFARTKNPSPFLKGSVGLSIS